MKQHLRDLKNGIVKLQAEHSEDLFTLSQLIEAGDTLEGRTIRKIKLDRGGDERKAAVVTRPVFLSIEVKDTEFTGDTLRVNGVVNEPKEDIPRGSHHTITVEPHDTITLVKPSWPTYQLSKIDESIAGEPPKILICILDRDEAYFALMRRVSYEMLIHLTSEPEKKAMKQSEKDFYSEVAKQVAAYDERFSFEAIIIASPAFFKDEVAKRLDDNIRKKIVLCTSSSVGKNGIDEVLKREESQSALSKARVGRQLQIVERLLREVATASGKAVYGIKACKQAASDGAIEALLVSEGTIQETRSDGTYEQLATIMKLADSTKATVHIISSDHDGGKQLDGLGGIAAILRYAVYDG